MVNYAAQKIKFSIKDFSSKCEKINRNLQILNGKLIDSYSVAFEIGLKCVST